MTCFHKIKSFILMRPGIKAPTDTKENAVSFLPGDRSEKQVFFKLCFKMCAIFRTLSHFQSGK